MAIATLWGKVQLEGVVAQSLVPKMRDPTLMKTRNHCVQMSVNQRVLVGCEGRGGARGPAGPSTNACLHLGDGLFLLGSGGPTEQHLKPGGQ